MLPVSPLAPERFPDLPTVAGVALATAETGLKYRERDDLRLIHHERLVEAWLEASRARVPPRLAVRSVFGDGVVHAVVTAGRDDYAVGGFEACQQRGVRHVHGHTTPEVDVAAPSDVIAAQLDLEICPKHQAEGLLIHPVPKSISRGATEVNGVMTVDLIQAALDVARRPARGQEQAEFIFEPILAWQAR